MITALTSNPKKAQEYADRLWMYGIRTSFRVSLEAPEEEVRALLMTQSPGSIVFRETSDIEVDGVTANATYRDAAFHGRQAQHVCKMTVWIRDGDDVNRHDTTITVPGTLRLHGVHDPAAFDWDDVFVPETHSRTYHETLLFSGKVSARQMAIDDMVSTHVSFRSNRAFKYGRVGDAGMVDLNHWPVRPAAPIQFVRLPIDDLSSNPVLLRSVVLSTPVGRMLTSALSDGAHYRAATNKREWIYWAPGVNAGIPLTPKEDPWAELVYLTHDYAHYAVPDLVPGPEDDGFTKACYVAHRMIGETMAMVTADMFLMEAFVAAGEPVDAAKHGIYQAYQEMRDPSLSQEDQFAHVLRQAVEVLLIGERRPSAVMRAFSDKYTRFALADYEWTIANVTAMHAAPNVLRGWRDVLTADVVTSLGLTEAKDFSAWVEHKVGGRSESFPDLLRAATGVVLERFVGPRMRKTNIVSREEVLTRSVKRYFAGQACMYAAHPDTLEHAAGPKSISEALSSAALSVEDAGHVRAAVDADISMLRTQNRITDMDARVYHSVFPITKPSYVSYSAPNFPDHESVMATVAHKFLVTGEPEIAH